MPAIWPAFVDVSLAIGVGNTAGRRDRSFARRRCGRLRPRNAPRRVDGVRIDPRIRDKNAPGRTIQIVR
jgi:hypothetical protein